MVAYLVVRHRDMSVLNLPLNPDIYLFFCNIINIICLIPVITSPLGLADKMCKNFTWTGSMAYLRNRGFPGPSKEDHCSCDVHFPKGTYIEFDMLTFVVGIR